MSSRTAPLRLKLNSKLLNSARTEAKNAGVPLTQFVGEIVEAEIATRRCRALPAQAVCDPPDNPYTPRPRGVDFHDMSGPSERYSLNLSRRTY
jgi:hypothetical protein